MYLSLLIVAGLVITNLVTFQITREVMQNNYRRKLKAKRAEEWKSYIDGEEGLNAEEVAAKRINEALPIDYDKSFKEYKLASLVVEHQDGYVTVEDHHLVNGEGDVVSLNEFKDQFEEVEDYRDIDWMLDSYKVLEAITANKDHEIVEEVKRFPDFNETLNNCYGGRHGKDKIDVKDAFVTFVDLSYEDLRIIATQKDEDIFKKQWRHEKVTEAKANSRRIRKERRQREFNRESRELEEAISMIFDKVNNIDKGVIGTLKEAEMITEAYEEAAPTIVEDDIITDKDLEGIKTFYAVVEDDVITDEELKDVKTFYAKDSLVEIELIDSIATEQLSKVSKSSKAIKKANKIKKTNTVSAIAKSIYEYTGYKPVNSLDALLKGGAF